MKSDRVFSKKWMSCPSELCNIRHSMTEICTKLKFSESETSAIVLAIDEACSNIIRYGYKNCSDGEILIEVATNQQQIIFRLHDQAKKVTTDCIASLPDRPLKPGGLGVRLMKKIMDTVKFIHTDKCPGNILEMRKDLPKERT